MFVRWNFDSEYTEIWQYRCKLHGLDPLGVFETEDVSGLSRVLRVVNKNKDLLIMVTDRHLKKVIISEKQFKDYL